MKTENIKQKCSQNIQNIIKQSYFIKKTDQNFQKFQFQSKNKSVCKSQIRSRSLYGSSNIDLKFGKNIKIDKNIQKNQKKTKIEIDDKKCLQTNNDIKVNVGNIEYKRKSGFQLGKPRKSNQNSNIVSEECHNQRFKDNFKNELKERNKSSSYLGNCKTTTYNQFTPLTLDENNFSNKNVLSNRSNNDQFFSESNNINNNYHTENKLLKKDFIGKIYCNLRLARQQQTKNKNIINNITLNNNEFHILDPSQLVHIFPLGDNNNSKYARNSLR